MEEAGAYEFQPNPHLKLHELGLRDDFVASLDPEQLRAVVASVAKAAIVSGHSDRNYSGEELTFANADPRELTAFAGWFRSRSAEEIAEIQAGYSEASVNAELGRQVLELSRRLEGAQDRANLLETRTLDMLFEEDRGQNIADFEGIIICEDPEGSATPMIATIARGGVVESFGRLEHEEKSFLEDAEEWVKELRAHFKNAGGDYARGRVLIIDDGEEVYVRTAAGTVKLSEFAPELKVPIRGINEFGYPTISMITATMDKETGEFGKDAYVQFRATPSKVLLPGDTRVAGFIAEKNLFTPIDFNWDIFDVPEGVAVFREVHAGERRVQNGYSIFGEGTFWSKVINDKEGFTRSMDELESDLRLPLLIGPNLKDGQLMALGTYLTAVRKQP